MKIKTRIIAVVSVCMLMAFSCEDENTFEYYLVNESESPLIVGYRLSYPEKSEILKVAPGDRKTLHKVSSIGGIRDLNEDFLRDFDSLGIFIEDVDQTEIQKHYLRRDAWDYQGSTSGGIPHNVYTLTIKNQDLK